MIGKETIESIIKSLTGKYGDDRETLIRRGVEQAASLWKKDDGDAEAFREFCLEHYHGEEASRRELFDTLSRNYETVWGHFNQLRLELLKPMHLEQGPVKPVDLLFGAYAPEAHVEDDLFDNRIAFLTILNFPFYSLEEKNSQGGDWNRREWAYARMGDIFTKRVPAAVNQHISRVDTDADNYVSGYNIIMGQLLNSEGRKLFPGHLRLISHWGLRDELKANYNDDKQGLEKQRMIYQIMLRIVDQSIPKEVINNDELNWNPFSNKVYDSDKAITAHEEQDIRYQHLLNNFRAHREADPYSPSEPTYIERAFNRGLEMNADEVESLFVSLLSAPVLKDVAAIIRKRLGRDLEPFDIWYDGFKGRSGISEEELDKIVKKKYPDTDTLQKDLPHLLTTIGFSEERARSLADRIVIEGARGAGHAWGGQMRSQKSHLRTRIPKEGMNYNGFNVAAHELGHNVEQTVSLHDVDHYMLTGVPNTAFTEALAFIFQKRDLQMLGINQDDPMSDQNHILDILWSTWEIMGISLVDMYVWQWMYKNPDATPADLKEKTIDIAMDVWNKYFAPVIGVENTPVLGIYSHMISYPLYLSAYPLGHLIEFQIEKQLRGKDFATEIERIFTLGDLPPRKWMQEAVGGPLSAESLLDAATIAVEERKK
ncbi:MAG: hypothetical protein R6U62_00695 [Bacteroidales bacterium]